MHPLNNASISECVKICQELRPENVRVEESFTNQMCFYGDRKALWLGKRGQVSRQNRETASAVNENTLL